MNSEWDLCELYCVVTDQYGMSDQTNTTVLYMVRADGLLYRISNGEATITGYIGNAAELVIPETIEDCPVTEIYEHAFGESGAECTTLESVYIPASVTDMDRGAFSFCPNLTSVTISEDNTVYTAIDNVVYTNAGTQLVFCAGGKTGSFAIPNTVTTISERAFEGCEKLETICKFLCYTHFERRIYERRKSL